MLQRITIFAILATMQLILGCGAVTRQGGLSQEGAKNWLTLKTEPSGAEVWLGGRLVGQTPCTEQFRSDGRYYLEFRKARYYTKTYNLNNHIAVGFVFADLIIPFGWVVDHLTGAWKYLDEKEINIILEPKSAETIGTK